MQLWTDPRLTLNMYADYNRRGNDKFDFRVAVNIDNILNDKDVYGEIYAPGTSWRITTGLTF